MTSNHIMTKWQEFLVNHAKFPFPKIVEDKYASSITDISFLEVGMLAPDWKAQFAVRDENLLQKLCQTLEDILGDTHIPDGCEDHLLSMFGRHLQFFPMVGGIETKNQVWAKNRNKAHVRILVHG